MHVIFSFLRGLEIPVPVGIQAERMVVSRALNNLRRCAQLYRDLDDHIR